MATLDNEMVQLSSTPPPNNSSLLLQITPEIHLAIFDTLDEGTSMLLGLTCKYFYKIHRQFYKSPTSLLTKIDNQDVPIERSTNQFTKCYPLISYLADWFPKESKATDGSAFTITLAHPTIRDAEGFRVHNSAKACLLGMGGQREHYGDARLKTLPTLHRFQHVEILLLSPVWPITRPKLAMTG